MPGPWGDIQGPPALGKDKVPVNDARRSEDDPTPEDRLSQKLQELGREIVDYDLELDVSAVFDDDDIFDMYETTLALAIVHGS
jgi:hypothetical protein